MSLESPARISQAGYHFLDYKAYPWWVERLFHEQLEDAETETLSAQLGIKPTDGTSSRLRKIQLFLHDSSYHMNQQDRISIYGFLSLLEIPYSLEMVTGAFSIIQRGLSAHNIDSKYNTWQSDLEQKRCVGSQMGSYSKSLELSARFRGKPPFQCAEEATLAAALACKVAGVDPNKIAFFVSPAHVMCFIRPHVSATASVKNGCIFDSKMLYFRSDMNRFGKTPEEKAVNFSHRFGDDLKIVDASGSLDSSAIIMSELLQFIGN